MVLKSEKMRGKGGQARKKKALKVLEKILEVQKNGMQKIASARFDRATSGL